jgi:hypothetical protein
MPTLNKYLSNTWHAFQHFTSKKHNSLGKTTVGETGPILDSRDFSLISPDPLRQKCFFLLRSFFILAPTPLIFFNGVTS